jgi:Sensors of blue-light using FAD
MPCSHKLVLAQTDNLLSAQAVDVWLTELQYCWQTIKEVQVMPLIQLIYCSRIDIPASEMASTMAHLFGKASARNKVNEVTGCLAYSAEYFIQVIEGDKPAVEETFGRISKDLRHSLLKVISQRDIRGRSFPDWHMAGFNLMEQSADFLDSFGLNGAFDPEKVLGSQLLLMLMQLADRRRMAE